MGEFVPPTEEQWAEEQGAGPGLETREHAIVARRFEVARRELLEPPRRCPDCDAKLTVQVLPHGYESKCTPCERRARVAAART